jgi:hypothetical protein
MTAKDIAMEYYQSKGLTKVQAAAIVGGFVVESNLNTRALGDRTLADKAHGIGQWRGKRWKHLQEFANGQAKEVHGLEVQLAFALHELKTTEKTAGDKLFAATTLEEAVDAMVGYERPGGWTAKNPRGAKTWKIRLKAARSLL